MRYLNAPFIISAHSSGSSVSARPVEPFMSQKSTVTMRRSPAMLRFARAVSSLLSSSFGMYCCKRARAGSTDCGLAIADCVLTMPSVDGGCSSVVGGRWSVVPTGVPQLKQNFALGMSLVPQFWQVIASVVPQLKQNFASSGLWVWQLGQFMQQSPCADCGDMRWRQFPMGIEPQAYGACSPDC